MIWIDLDNSPHVPLFRPIIGEIDRRGVGCLVTAREFAQTADLLNMWSIEHALIGKHGGKSKVKKVLNLAHRSSQLMRYVRNKKISVAVSHGSRTQLMACKAFGTPSILMLDYEYTESGLFNRLSTNLLIPSFIPDARLRDAGFNMSKVIRYTGFKEELYLDSFVPDPAFRASISVPDDAILVVIRPPGVVGNYHNSRSEELFAEAVRHCSSNPDARVIIISKVRADKSLLARFGMERMPDNVRYLDRVVDGLQLLWAADMAISGGGTMNRESALLGTETYSIFTGRRPYLDEFLQDQGRLKFIEHPADIAGIEIARKSKQPQLRFGHNLAPFITDIILSKSKEIS
jgi:predicted glycosyltransferase